MSFARDLSLAVLCLGFWSVSGDTSAAPRRAALSMVKENRDLSSWRGEKDKNSIKPIRKAKVPPKKARLKSTRKSVSPPCTGGRKKCTSRRSTRDRWPPMTLKNVNTHESLVVRLYNQQGQTVKSTIPKLRYFLRCHATHKQHGIDWRLIRKIYQISRQYPGKTLLVYSGYRARKVSQSGSSRHLRGQAIDFSVEGVSRTALRDFLLKNFTLVGIGYYPNSPFVHLDVRAKRSAFWVDFSGKGVPPQYAADPMAYLRRERLGILAKHVLTRNNSKAVERLGPHLPPFNTPTVIGPLPLKKATQTASEPPNAEQAQLTTISPPALVHTPLGQVDSITESGGLAESSRINKSTENKINPSSASAAEPTPPLPSSPGPLLTTRSVQ